MKSSREKKREARILLVTYFVLIASTVGSFWLADAGAASTSRVGTTGWVLGFGAMKGLVIAGVFMEMRHGPRVWAFGMTGFLFSEAVLLTLVLP